MLSSNGNHSGIGLALGSGSARGWAHIGIIQALKEMGIEPDIIAGSSIGALVGAAYASDQLNEFEKLVRAITWKNIMSYLDMSVLGGGLIKGDKLADFFRKYTNDYEIESLPRRFATVATELDTGREVWFEQGDLLNAVRASVSLPGLFTPFLHNDRWMVDGGIVNPVPVTLCRAMGAKVVIAVSLNSDIVGKHGRSSTDKNSRSGSGQDMKLEEAALWERISGQLERKLFQKKNDVLSRLFGENLDAPGLFEALAGSINIMQDRITRSRLAGDPPDIMLSPKLADLGLLEFDQGDVAIEEGKACVNRMRESLEQILAG